MSQHARKATNLTLDTDLVAEAKALKVNVSRAAEAGIAEAIRREKARIWQDDNAAAVAGANAWVEKNGLPLGKYRLF
jgi:antitoxin CcdA